MARFPMKMKLINQTIKKTESSNSYSVNFKYLPKDYMDTLKTTLTITADSKEVIDLIKDELSIISVGELFFLGVGKDPQKRLDEFFEPVKELEPSDKFEEFKILAKGIPNHELSAKFYKIKEDIEKIEEKKRKTKQDKDRLGFLKQCYDHLEEDYFITPKEQTYEAIEEKPSNENPTEEE